MLDQSPTSYADQCGSIKIRFHEFILMWLNKDHCRSIKINSSQYDLYWATFWINSWNLIFIDLHWSAYIIGDWSSMFCNRWMKAFIKSWKHNYSVIKVALYSIFCANLYPGFWLFSTQENKDRLKSVPLSRMTLACGYTNGDLALCNGRLTVQ